MAIDMYNSNGRAASGQGGTGDPCTCLWPYGHIHTAIDMPYRPVPEMKEVELVFIVWSIGSILDDVHQANSLMTL